MYDISFDDRTAELNEILEDLMRGVEEIEACSIVSIEGLPICSKMPEEYDDTIVAAMTAAMLSLGDKIASSLTRGTLKKVSVEGENGHIISQYAGSNAVLTISTSKEVKLGLVFMELGSATNKIGELLG